MSAIDFHSHVLPRIDDGSHSSEESLGMLQISASQGIDVMAATSHFYATEDRISSFLNRRRCSEERLKERMNQELTKEERIPRLIMGAEVAFFTGISRAERLEELTYEGTDLLLLEMPFTKWNKSEIEEVRYILERRKLRVMLAHLERFLMIPGNKKRIYELMELPVYVQINAGSFERWGERRQISKMIRKKEQIFLGSDCHGIHHRVPNLKNGREALEKMMGSTFIDKMDLFIGEDDRGVKTRKTESDGTGQSDVLELLVIDTKKNTYHKLPINRDTITDVKSLDDDGSYLATTKTQIALAHAKGDGMELSCENTVDAVSHMLYGIRIEGYISLNMDSIKILNHLAGGVPVTIEDDFSQSDPSLVMGQNITLTDDQAMHYVHDRMNVGDGTNECRMRRQKAYVDALFPLYKAKLQADSGFINEFYNDLSDYMVTDMSVGEMGNVANMIMNSEDKGELSIKGTNAIAEDDGFNEFTMDETSRGEVAMELFFNKVEK